jgi:hypothetical protein
MTVLGARTSETAITRPGLPGMSPLLACEDITNEEDERGKERIRRLKASSRVPFSRLRRATKTDETSVIDHINKLRGSDSRNFISRGHNSPASGRNAEKERERERERERVREREEERSEPLRSRRIPRLCRRDTRRAAAAGTARLLSQTICDEPVYRLSHFEFRRETEKVHRETEHRVHWIHIVPVSRFSGAPGRALPLR